MGKPAATPPLPRAREPASAADVDFEYVHGAFTHRHSKDIVSVRAAAIESIVRASENGLRLIYLDKLHPILTKVLESIESGEPDSELFVKPFCALLALHGKAFNCARDYEEIEYAYQLSENFALIGQCLDCSNHEVIRTATKAISNFVGLNRSSTDLSSTPRASSQKLRMGSDEKVDLHRCPPQLLNYYVVAHSGVIPMLIEALHDQSEEHESLALEVVRAVKDVSFSAVCAKQIIERGLFGIIPVLLDKDAKSQQVDVVLELIWNIIEADPAACAAFGNEANILSLMSLLQQLLDKGHRDQDKELRNQILVILSLVARVEANRPNLARTTCLRTVLLYSTCAELYNSDVHAKLAIQPYTQSTDALDLEMKLLMWALVGQCITEKFSHAQAVQGELLRALLIYFDEREASSNPTITRWSYTQLLQIQRAALAIIIKIAPKLPEQFAALNALDTLVSFAGEVVANPDNLVSRQLARQQVLELQALALSALLYVTQDDSVGHALPSIETLACLLDIFADPEKSSKVAANAITVVASLVRTVPENRETFRRAGGLRIVAARLKAPDFLERAVRKEPVLLGSIVECVWNAVAGEARNEAFFFVEDGMRCLLDLLEACPANMTKQVLGLVAELLANEDAAPHFHDWRGSKIPGALAMVLGLWGREDERLAAGTIKAGDVSDLQPTIFSLFASLGFQGLPKAGPAEETTLRAVQAYLPIRRGRVFADIQMSLQALEGIVPVDSDQAMLDVRIAECERLEQDVAGLLGGDRERQAGEADQEMGVFFDTIRAKLQRETKPKAPTTANTSVMKNRMAAKAMKNSMISNSLDVDATLKKTAGSGARAALGLRQRNDPFGDPEFQTKYAAQLDLQGCPSMPFQKIPAPGMLSQPTSAEPSQAQPFASTIVQEGATARAL